MVLYLCLGGGPGPGLCVGLNLGQAFGVVLGLVSGLVPGLVPAAPGPGLDRDGPGTGSCCAG